MLQSRRVPRVARIVGAPRTEASLLLLAQCCNLGANKANAVERSAPSVVYSVNFDVPRHKLYVSLVIRKVIDMRRGWCLRPRATAEARRIQCRNANVDVFVAQGKSGQFELRITNQSFLMLAWRGDHDGSCFCQI